MYRQFQRDSEDGPDPPGYPPFLFFVELATLHPSCPLSLPGPPKSVQEQANSGRIVSSAPELSFKVPPNVQRGGSFTESGPKEREIHTRLMAEMATYRTYLVNKGVRHAERDLPLQTILNDPPLLRMLRLFAESRQCVELVNFLERVKEYSAFVKAEGNAVAPTLGRPIWNEFLDTSASGRPVIPLPPAVASALKKAVESNAMDAQVFSTARDAAVSLVEERLYPEYISFVQSILGEPPEGAGSKAEATPLQSAPRRASVRLRKSRPRSVSHQDGKNSTDASRPEERKASHQQDDKHHSGGQGTTEIPESPSGEEKKRRWSRRGKRKENSQDEEGKSNQVFRIFMSMISPSRFALVWFLPPWLTCVVACSTPKVSPRSGSRSPR